MSKHSLEISPEDIRAIRRRLSISQVEAGELIGGGPRAFTKYEAGTVKPAASVIKLLRLLEEAPSLLGVLKGNKHVRNAATARSPFEVADDHISALNERMLHELLRRLLNAEAHANGIHTDRIHVASNIHAPDGGIDGYIIWRNGPARTEFLPSRHCYFQLKSGKVSPSKAAREVLGTEGWSQGHGASGP